RITGQA
ncbi:hypothetical protein MK373_02590, partial [Streptococcus oralis]|nr:hypothetical protein [Streptococcus oralis]